MSPRQAERPVRGVHPLPSRQAETLLRGVQNATRGSAEFEADQARAEESSRDQAGARDQARNAATSASATRTEVTEILVP